MPSLQTWRQAVSPSDLHFNSTTIQLRNHHYPPGDRNISNFVNTTKGMGTPITNTSTPSSANFNVGALNTTRVLTGNTNDFGIDFYNAVLYLKSSAQGQLPNTDQTRTFYHENLFHPFPLSKAKLVDPGITLSYSNETKNFTVEATTGVAVWTWLDNPAGTLLNFDANAFILLPGQPREVGYTLKSDSTGGDWVNEVTVESLWNNTLAD